MKTVLSFVAFSLLSFATLFAQAPKTADFASNNILNSPDFGGSPCYAGWEIEVVGVACNVGPEYVWLNHNNRAGDPAVKQTLNNLTVGAEYEIVVGWRGGDHGPIHGVRGARNVFAIDIDGREIHRLTTGPNFTDWMVNDKVVANGQLPADYKTLTFTATATSHTIRFRGEVGADGDVLIDWVQVKSSKMNVCNAIDELINAVNADSGLRQSEKTKMLANLNNAKDKMCGAKENKTPAINNLETFVRKAVAESRQNFADDAQAIIDAINSGNYTTR